MPSEPEPESRYIPAWVVLLPTAFRPGKGCITTPTPWWRRLGRQLVPRRTVLDCCDYHRADWHKASKTAIRYLRDAQRAGIDPICWDGDTLDYVDDRAEREGITGVDLEALISLFHSPIGVSHPRDYWDGQHRARAMMDAGVRRTVVRTE